MCLKKLCGEKISLPPTGVPKIFTPVGKKFGYATEDAMLRDGLAV